MNLAEFLRETEMTPPQFASEIGVNPETIRRIVNGYEPSLGVALLIEKYTRRLVKGEDLLGKLSHGKGRPRKLKTEAIESKNTERGKNK